MSASQRFVDAFMRVPYPWSKWAYAALKPRLFPDPRAPLFDKVFETVAADKQPGDYLEFGVFRGSSFTTAYHSSQRYGCRGMRFFAFDSFKGLPHAESQVMKQGAYASPKTTFLTMTRKAGVNPKVVRTVEGFFSDTLTGDLKRKERLAEAAVVHIDSDLHSSAQEVLAFIDGLVRPETILIFDNWYSFRNDGADIETVGERRAFREWPLRSCFDDFYDIPNVSKAFIMRDRTTTEKG